MVNIPGFPNGTSLPRPAVGPGRDGRKLPRIKSWVLPIQNKGSPHHQLNTLNSPKHLQIGAGWAIAFV